MSATPTRERGPANVVYLGGPATRGHVHTGSVASSRASRRKAKRAKDSSPIEALEREKFQLLKEKAAAQERKSTLEDRVTRGMEELRLKEATLAGISSRLLESKNQQKGRTLGKLGAAAEVQRIVRLKIRQKKQEMDVLQEKLNRQEDQNAKCRRQIDAMRREHVTFTQLFEDMHRELNERKAKVQETVGAIKASREHVKQIRLARRDVRERMVEAKQIAAMEFRHQTRAIEEAERQANPSSDKVEAGSLSPDAERELRLGIRQMKWQLQIAKANLTSAQGKKDVYREAIERLKSQTGVTNLRQLVDRFQQMNELKAENVLAAGRAVSEIEALNSQIQELRRDFESKEGVNEKVKSAKVADLARLQQEAQALEADKVQRAQQTHQMKRNLRAMIIIIEEAYTKLGCTGLLDGITSGGGGGGKEEESQELQPPTPLGGAEGGVGNRPRRQSFNRSSPSPVSPSPNSLTSPLKQSQGNMFANARLRQVVSERPTLATLDQFVGMMEQRSMELVHRVALMQKAKAETAEAERQQQLEDQLEDPDRDEASLSLDDEAAAAAAEGKVDSVPLVPIGPPRPRGALHEMMTSAAILAAMLDTSKLEVASADDGSKPFTREQMEEQAMLSMSGPQYLVTQAASKDAARYLTRANGRTHRGGKEPKARTPRASVSVLQ